MIGNLIELIHSININSIQGSYVSDQNAAIERLRASVKLHYRPIMMNSVRF